MDDVKEDVENENEVEETPVELPIGSTDPVSISISTSELYEAEVERHNVLLEENRNLEAVLALYFADSEILNDKDVLTADVNIGVKYENLLDIIEEIEEDTTEFIAKFEAEKATSESELNEKEEELMECYKEFYELKKKIAQRAIHSATGQSLPPNKIEYYLRKETEVDEDIRNERFKFIKETNALQKERTRKSHLSMAGQSMGLEEYKLTVFDTQVQKNGADTRKEELEIVKKKCWEVVNIITHLKLKQLYLSDDKRTTKEKLAELNEKVNNMTQGMLATKAEHETTTRRKLKELKKKYALMHDDVLPKDYERLKETDDKITEELQHLKDDYYKLSSELRHKKK